jgi:3-deoxy-D-manno-octulosonic-acid transferase
LFNNKAKLFIAGRRNLLGKMRDALIDERRPRIWMHCASLGEFEQGRPVLEKLRAKYSNHAIVLTFYSPSGYEIRKNYEGADYIFYLPVDNPVNVSRFLKIVQPALCIFVKYEFWYFYLSRIARKDIPLILISAIFRSQQPFFQWYGYMHRRMLRCFTHIFVQDNDSQMLLERHGINDVTVSGDTRFDRVVEAAESVRKYDMADEFCRDATVLVAGSTWPKDEQILAEVLDKLQLKWKFIIAPHEVHESHIQDIEKLFEGKCIRWSEGTVTPDRRVLIVDKIGLLMNLYGYAYVAFIGGGFDSAGIHNVPEASVYGIPAMFGPVYHQYKEAIDLVNNGGAISVNSSDEILNQLHQWSNNSKSYIQASATARQYIVANAGATKKILAYLEAKNWLSS